MNTSLQRTHSVSRELVTVIYLFSASSALIGTHLLSGRSLNVPKPSRWQFGLCLVHMEGLARFEVGHEASSLWNSAFLLKAAVLIYEGKGATVR